MKIPKKFSGKFKPVLRWVGRIVLALAFFASCLTSYVCAAILVVGAVDLFRLIGWQETLIVLVGLMGFCMALFLIYLAFWLLMRALRTVKLDS